MSSAGAPAFSPDGQYLYFSASTTSGPTEVGLDMSTQERPYRYGMYAFVLASNGRSPLLPKSDEEKVKKKASDDKDDEDDAAANDDAPPPPPRERFLPLSASLPSPSHPIP